jgi:hypothetical protein
MNYEPDKDLENLIQEELHRLPDLKAPATLIQRVNARVQVGESVPWWRQSWLGWPPAVKLGSLAVFVALIAFSVFRLSEVDFASHVEQTQSGFQSISSLWTKLAALMNAFVLLNRTFTDHFLIWVLPVLALMAFATIAAGSGLWRLTLQENHETWK